ncbi:FAD-dependent monooxygenase [Kitasatospora sp. NPDC052896]|uniref:FAD-dependent monooxygenase n=1 Tax=Kitasatospora sp. NPDC052896 TaxID=3364061 RepID=UPI0037C8D001
MTRHEFTTPATHGDSTPAPDDRRVLISGAGIAGTVLAHLLARAGLRVTVVEYAPGVRTGGNAVDLRGAAVDVVAAMGVLDPVRAQQTGNGAMHRIDREGDTIAMLPAEAIAGDVELPRGDLNAILLGAAQDGVEYLFGDTVTALADTGDDVRVTFDSGARRTFDLVVGADGLHSRTRSLAFGPETDFVRHLGCYQGHFTMPNTLGLDRTGLLLNLPGRTLGCYTVHDNRDLVVGWFFRSESLTYDRRDIAAQQRLVAEAFTGLGWKVPELVDAMHRSTDFYFDPISQVVMDGMHRGRIVLAGDAAHAPSLLSGVGATLAIVGAAVLAEEIISSPDDAEAAFARYEKRINEMVTLGRELAVRSKDWFVFAEGAGDHRISQAEEDRVHALREDVVTAANRACPQV